MATRLKSAEEIGRMTDDQLRRYNRFLHGARNSRDGEISSGHPRRARWCFYEVKRELFRRGLAPKPAEPPQKTDRSYSAR